MRLGSVPPATGEWECSECGYVEEGVQAKRPPQCPECGAPGTAFEFFAGDGDDDDWDSDDEGGAYDDDLEDEYEEDEDFDEEDEDY